MALIDQWNAAMNQDPNSQAAIGTTQFNHRVCMAAISAAISIINEATTTPDHANRAAFAVKVTNRPFDWMIPLTLGVASQGLDNTATDAAINNAIASIWDAFSG